MKRVAVSVLLATMVACQADQMLPPPTALIQDAGHNGGNQFFAFLQPMVAQPTSNGVFDPNLTPTVKVQLAPGSTCSDPAVTYTMTSGPASDASERIRVNPTDHNYIVNLHTDQVPVISGCTYRIRILVGAMELGFADIELFLTQKAAKNITTSETLALVDGKTLPIKFWIAGGALCASGADCGQGTAYPDRDNTIVTQNLQAGVFIPTGAVPEGTTIIIQSIDHRDRPCFPGLLGQTFQGQSGASGNSCYEFRADPPLPGGKFNAPVVVGLCVDLSGVSHDQEPKIQILQFDAGNPDRKTLDRIRPLKNVAAPFLPCDPRSQVIGSRKHGILDFAARLIRSIVSPRPLYAHSRMTVFDVGAGGSSDGFSTFTWGLVTNMAEHAGNLQTAAVGTAVATPPSVIFTDSTGALVDSVPVTFTVVGAGGSVTGAVTKSGRGGVSGVAQVGSWTLGSVGLDSLIASAPESSTVTPTRVLFTATGTGAFSTIGGLASARQFHSAVGLANGVMILGGVSGGFTTLSSVEFYDTIPKTFVPLASMLSPREQFGAAIFGGLGGILATGGLIRGTPATTLASAERYDWATNTWHATGNMTTARSEHTATTLADGRVLVTGGVGASGAVLANAEIYDPAADAFTAVGNMAFAREGHTATLLPGGKVLITGGFNGASVGQAELFNPVTNTFATTGTLNVSRHAHTATRLYDGTVLLTGGVHIVSGAPATRTATAEIYSPITGVFTLTGSMSVARAQHDAALLWNGRVLVAGGGDAADNPLASAELYDPAAGTFSSAGNMANARTRHTVTTLPTSIGKALIVGGEGATVLQSVELFVDP